MAQQLNQPQIYEVISSATLQHTIGQKTQRGVYDLTQRTRNVGLHRHSLE